jgi:hypothetical protein
MRFPYFNFNTTIHNWMKLKLKHKVHVILSMMHWSIIFAWLATGRWFSPGPPVSYTNKTDSHDLTEILCCVKIKIDYAETKMSVKFEISRTCLAIDNKTCFKQFRIVYYTQTQPHYLCPYFRGGLGNLMFMYASLYGIAKTNEMILVLNEKDHINSVGFCTFWFIVTMKSTTQTDIHIKVNQ